MNLPTFKYLRFGRFTHCKAIAAALVWVLIVPCLGVLPWSGGALAEGTGAGSRSLAAATQLLEQARAEAARGCGHPSDDLVRILCEQRLRVGLRAYYPGFSMRDE